MKTPRFFILKENIKENCTSIKGSDVHHIKDVLRLKEKDQLEIFDGTYEYKANILSIASDRVAVKIFNKQKIELKNNINITLCQAVPKGAKMDTVIQMCSEIGVDTIIPMITERTIVRFDNTAGLIRKISRWRRIAEESAKQCGRIDVLIPA